MFNLWSQRSAFQPHWSRQSQIEHVEPLRHRKRGNVAELRGHLLHFPVPSILSVIPEHPPMARIARYVVPGFKIDVNNQDCAP